MKPRRRAAELEYSYSRLGGIAGWPAGVRGEGFRAVAIEGAWLVSLFYCCPRSG